MSKSCFDKLPSADVLNQMLIYMINTYTDEKYGASGDFETIKEDIISATGMSEAHFESIKGELDFVFFTNEQQDEKTVMDILDDAFARIGNVDGINKGREKDFDEEY